MSGRVVVRLPWSDLTICRVLFTRPPAGGAGGASCLPGHVPSDSEGRERAGAKRGAGGGEDNFPCSVALLSCFVDLILLYYSFAYCIRILCQILYFGIPTAVLLYRIFPNQIAN